METLADKFYKSMPNHCSVKTIEKGFKAALDKHLKKFKWTIEYQQPGARAVIGDFHNIIRYENIDHLVNTRFKTLLSAYKHSQTLEDAVWIMIKRNEKKGGTVVLPGKFIVWTEKTHTPFINEVNIKSPLFRKNRFEHRSSKDYVLKLLESWWKVTPEVFKQYYPKLDFKETIQKGFGSAYY